VKCSIAVCFLWAALTLKFDQVCGVGIARTYRSWQTINLSMHVLACTGTPTPRARTIRQAV